MKNIKILLTGKNGQLGYELERSLQALGEVVALGRSDMDLADLQQVRECIRTVKPTLIINPAAYTAVDKAENEPDLAFKVNAEAPAVMAEEAKKLGAAMVHYSTDYVFDGTKGMPYVEQDVTCPINVYGASKLAGEQAVQAAGIAHLILRTSWVYGMRGKNFLLTMLRLAQERDSLGVVADQHGAPTWCRTIADTTAHILTQEWQEKSGLYHLTAQGQTTWHGLTLAILQNAQFNQASGKQVLVQPIATQDYPLPAARPAYSVLSCEKLQQTFCRLPHWEEALRLCQR